MIVIGEPALLTHLKKKSAQVSSCELMFKNSKSLDNYLRTNNLVVTDGSIPHNIRCETISITATGRKPVQIMLWDMEAMPYLNVISNYMVLPTTGSEIATPFATYAYQLAYCRVMNTNTKDWMRAMLRLHTLRELYWEPYLNSAPDDTNKMQRNAQMVGASNKIRIPLQYKKELYGFSLVGASKMNKELLKIVSPMNKPLLEELCSLGNYNISYIKFRNLSPVFQRAAFLERIYTIMIDDIYLVYKKSHKSEMMPSVHTIFRKACMRYLVEENMPMMIDRFIEYFPALYKQFNRDIILVYENAIRHQEEKKNKSQTKYKEMVGLADAYEAYHNDPSEENREILIELGGTPPMNVRLLN